MIGFSVKSDLPPRLRISRMANPRIFCGYEFSPPQLLQNLQLRKPLASADSKATLTSLDSILTEHLSATPLESILTEMGGRGGPSVPVPTPPNQPRVTNHRTLYAQCYHPRSVPLPNRQLRTDD